MSTKLDLILIHMKHTITISFLSVGQIRYAVIIITIIMIKKRSKTMQTPALWL